MRAAGGSRLLVGWGLGLGTLALLTVACARVEDPSLAPDPALSAPTPSLRALAPDPHRQVFWGDLHIHTSFSYDAYTFGVRALPDDAYRYAKGETIEHAFGYPLRLSQPLDFAAVTDHAEYLGAARSLDGAAADGPPPIREIMASGRPWRITWNYFKVILGSMISLEKRQASFGRIDASEASRLAWQEIVASAERHNAPGRFTTFIGYEWTSMPAEENLHRNVIYATHRFPDRPFSALDSEDPEDLWRALDGERAKGMEMIAIPHNGNVSNGRMYDRRSHAGEALTESYAERRMRNEPISEILQVKGQSEVHPLLASEDEFANFEIYDKLLSAGGGRSRPSGSYARDALKTGLELSQSRGFNPYRFGVIGSSDGHNASSPVDEDRYHGKLPLLDGSAGLRLGETLLIPRSQNRGGQWSAMGLAGVWAEENTRQALFAALRRKETYASSGPRILLRFFAGWDFEASLLDDPALLAKADARGVPMGGLLPSPAGPGAPRFVVLAAKDPEAAHLDRIQIIKAWVDASGQARERIHDVAASGGRRPDPTSGRLAAVGNSVDVTRATYRNSIGAATLESVWRDPDFDPSAEAFYYVRVLEIPTPRWSTYDAVVLGVTPPEPTTLQERAISSAIWYRPATP